MDTHNGTVWSITPEGRINPEGRADFLAKIWPGGRSRDLQVVKPIVTALILETDVTSGDSLRSLMTIGCKFGIWCLSNTPDATFNPSRDLSEDRLHDFRIHALAGLARSTGGTYLSALRRLGGHAPKARPVGREAASPPYPRRVAQRLWTTALELDDWTATEMRTLLALTLGAGALGEEVSQIRASQIEVVGPRVTALLTRKHVLRDVPVYDEFAQWLRDRATQLDPDAYLFRPTVMARRNAISDFVVRAARRSDVFEGFKATRARHTWICHYLQVGLPYNVLCATAGVGAGSNLFADLSPHLPRVTAAEARRAFEHTHTRKEVA